GIDGSQPRPRRLVAGRARADAAALLVVLARDRGAEAEERALAVDAGAIVLGGARGVEAVGLVTLDLLHPAHKRAVLRVDEDHAGVRVDCRPAPVDAADAAGELDGRARRRVCRLEHEG